MELILKEDVANLGYKDDIVNVKRGYGRNYLIPTGKAVIATESARKVLAENLRQRAHKLAQIKADAEAMAEKSTASKSLSLLKLLLLVLSSVLLTASKWLKNWLNLVTKSTAKLSLSKTLSKKLVLTLLQ